MTITKSLTLILIIIILAFSYFLRLQNYSKIPFPGESMDEYSFSWVGLSLIQTGTPIGISGIPGYKSYDFRYINVDQVFKSSAKGNPFAINTPWFDHPPLLGLITGGFAYFKGANIFEDSQISLIRKPMIAIGALSILLLFLYIKNIFGTLQALITSAIYATSPLAIISSRMVQAENLLIPLLLLSHLLLYYYFKNQKSRLLWAASLIAGASLLIKLSGIAIILSGSILILINDKDHFKKALPNLLVFNVVSLSFLILLISYAASFDLSQFLSILSSNSQRFYGIGANAFFELLTSTKITSLHFLTDGWILAGWISVLLLLASLNNQKKEIWILVPLISYLAVFILFGSESYGWYRFPFLPFLFAAVAAIIVRGYKDINYAFVSFLILLLPIGVSISKIVEIEAFQRYAFFWKWSLVGLLITLTATSFLITKNRQLKLVVQLLVWLLFLYSITLNLQYFSLITPDYWRQAF